MSDENRNDAGQFTPAEPLTGQAGIEADHGYKRMPEDEAPPEPTSDIMAEVEKLQASRVPADDPVIPIEYQRLDSGEKAPQNETVTLERAADDLTAYHGQQDEERARSVSSDFAAEIDKMRADAIKDNPDIAKELALSKEEIAAAEAAKEPSPSETNDAARAESAKPATEEPSDYDDIPGLTPETKAAMRSPQIRTAIEAEFTKAAQTQEAYTTALQQGQQVARATIASLAPQLDGIPLEQWPQAIQMLAEVDPVRGKLVVDALQNWSTIQQAEAQQQQQRAYVQQQQFDAYSKVEDAKFASMVGNMTPAQQIEFGNEMVSYASELGVTKDQLVHQLRSNPVFRSAAFQKMAFDAVQYRRMQKAPKPKPTRDLPPVTRPGTSGHARGDSDSTKIASLRAKVSNSSGHAAIRAAAELQRAMRKA